MVRTSCLTEDISDILVETTEVSQALEDKAMGSFEIQTFYNPWCYNPKAHVTLSL
jgi:hypothetical protein